MELYLIRHAQSQNNARPTHERVEDPPITPLGRQQAQLLAKWIAQLQLDIVITSPFLRSLQTTEPIWKATGLVPEVRIDLHEQGGCMRGTDEANLVGAPGMTRTEIEARFPAFEVHPEIDGEGWWRGQPYESIDRASERARQLLARSQHEYGGSGLRIAYVMHADFKRILLGHVHSEPLDVPFNTSVTKLAISRRECRLDDYNSVRHLPTDLHSS